MSALEASVTLEDVFTVVQAKRVPLAPELAGYLCLEIADGTDAGTGDVDPRTVFISEEGTVALVRPRRDVITGEAESSVRAILTKLLDASGSATPALTVAARRKAGNGLPALVEELEAALIPVNRAAGRRALARLARETKRVLMGIGRNASVPPVSSGTRHERNIEHSLAAPADVPMRTARSNAFDEEAATLPKRSNPMSAPAAERPTGTTAPRAVSARGSGSIPPPPDRPASPSPVPPPARNGRDKLLGSDAVESLLDTFGVSNVRGEKQMSRDLKAIAGLSPTPPPPNGNGEALTNEIAKDVSKSGDADVEALLALGDASGPVEPPDPPTVAKEPSASAAAVAARASRSHERNGSPPRTSVRDDLEVSSSITTGAGRDRRNAATVISRDREPRAPKTSFALLLLVLVVLVGAAGFIWWKAPRLFTGKRRPVVPAAAPSASPAPATARCKVALVVTDAPENAEILLRMGQAPLDVDRMPVGTRLEFVGTAEGYAPKRAVVKADSTWDKGEGGKPRIDVPIQLDPTKARPGAVDPWPGAEPGSQVGGSGAPGTVHVVSNVRGAEVWLLAGLGPEARIEQLRCDGDIDVLLAGPTAARKRLHVGEKEIAAATPDPQGNKVVTVSAK